MRIKHVVRGRVGFGWEPADFETRRTFGVVGLLRLGIVALAFHERWNANNRQSRK